MLGGAIAAWYFSRQSGSFEAFEMGDPKVADLGEARMLIIFGDAEKDDIELVRNVVLRRLLDDFLRNTPPDQLDSSGDGYKRYVTFPQYNNQQRFQELAVEIFWELIVQGVVVPGGGGYVGQLPFYRVSDYGRTVLESAGVAPYYPQGYIDRIRGISKACLGAVALGYLQEALNCFRHRCYAASVLLLGVATEAVFLEVCAAVQGSIRDPKDARDFEKLDMVKTKHRWIVAKYEALPAGIRREHLPDGLDVTLKGVYDLIRRQRNELGHPQVVSPEIDREHAFALFQIFPTYVKDVEAFANYCQKIGL